MNTFMLTKTYAIIIIITKAITGPWNSIYYHVDEDHHDESWNVIFINKAASFNCFLIDKDN